MVPAEQEPNTVVAVLQKGYRDRGPRSASGARDRRRAEVSVSAKEAACDGQVPIDATAFAVFDMQELSAETFDAALESAADEVAVVFFWGFECFNCEIAKKAMLAKPDEIRALGLKWFHSNVYEHRELGRRFMLHGVPRGSSSTAASGSAGQPAGTALGSSKPLSRPRGKRSGWPMQPKRDRMVEKTAKVRPIEKN